MSGTLYLLDTNIVLTLVRGNALAAFIDREFGLRASKVRSLISIVTHAEVRVIAGRNQWGKAKLEALQNALDNLVTSTTSTRRCWPSSTSIHTPPRRIRDSVGPGEMNDRQQRWGLYPWFEEHGAMLIHPQDVAIVRALMPYCKVFRVVDEGEDFIRLSYGAVEFRVCPSLFQEVTSEVHAIGESVELEGGRTGEVIAIQWHYKRAEPMYQLRVDGKRKSKRFWNADFASS